MRMWSVGGGWFYGSGWGVDFLLVLWRIIFGCYYGLM